MIRRLLFFVIVICVASVRAQTLPMPQRVHQGETQQQSLRTRTRQVADQISAIIEEFNRNALPDGEDVHTLKAVQSVLSGLSDQDMDKVVALLQQARMSPADAARRNVA